MIENLIILEDLASSLKKDCLCCCFLVVVFAVAVILPPNRICYYESQCPQNRSIQFHEHELKMKTVSPHL